MDQPPALPLDPADLVAEAQGLQDQTVALRRKIHRRPELGLELPETQAAILEALEPLRLDTTLGTRTSSVVAVLEGDRPGPTTLLRGDMDALGMPEDTGLNYSSEIDGRMHACGHDAHVAMLVSAAHLLHRRRRDLAGRVVFMFQPGEEGHGGAKVMLEEGLLSAHGKIDRAFAIHVTPVAPAGWLTARGGTLMASADEFSLKVTGKGGHASMPHDAIDPMPVACEIVGAIQAMITRTIPVFDPAVITVSKIHAGTASNVIPESVLCEGTIRAVSEKSRDAAIGGLRKVATNIAAAHDCQAEVSLDPRGYPVTVNDKASAARTLDMAAHLFGQRRAVEMPSPVMGAEDWSYVLQMVPGSMAFLGVAPAGVANPAPNHSNRMLIDEEAMATGVAMHAAMALGA